MILDDNRYQEDVDEEHHHSNVRDNLIMIFKIILKGIFSFEMTMLKRTFFIEMLKH